MGAFVISESSFLGLVCDKVAMGQHIITLCFKEGQRRKNFLNPTPCGDGGARTTPSLSTKDKYYILFHTDCTFDMLS